MATRYRTVIQQPSTGTPVESWDITHDLGEEDVTITMRPSHPPVGAMVNVPVFLSNVTESSVRITPYVDSEGGPELIPAGYYVVQVVPTGSPV